jgi:eukaryotic-like serine/threonine-protein kinase
MSIFLAGVIGHCLRKKGRSDEAIHFYKEAIRLKPDFAESHCELGSALQSQGHFEEALAALRRGHELGSKRARWKYPTDDWIRRCERLLQLDRKLPAVLEGTSSQVAPSEKADLAKLCLQFKRRPVASVRLFQEAFAGQPDLATNLLGVYRYNGSCAAVIAAAGKGVDVADLGEMDQLALRRQALTWLRADLNAWAALLEKFRPLIVKAMKHWLADEDFASVRGPEALAKLPFAERQAWRQLWADVADLLARAEKTPPQPKK